MTEVKVGAPSGHSTISHSDCHGNNSHRDNAQLSSTLSENWVRNWHTVMRGISWIHEIISWPESDNWQTWSLRFSWMVPIIEPFPWVSHGFAMALQEGNEIDGLLCSRIRVYDPMTRHWELEMVWVKFSLLCSMFRLDGNMPSKPEERRFHIRNHFQVNSIIWEEHCGWLCIPESCILLQRVVKELLGYFGFFFLPRHKCSVSSCSRERMPTFLHLSIFTIGSPE